MKILQVITDDDRRGAQVFAVDLQEAMRSAGHEVDTVALHRGHGGLPVEVLGRSDRSPRTIWRLRRRLRGVDVVLAHGSTTLPVGVLAALGTGVPVVYRQIADPFHWAPTWPKRVRVAALLRGTAHIVALAPGAKQDFMTHYRLRPEDITVVPNGVPADRVHEPDAKQRSEARARLGRDDGALLVVYLGALVPEKGVDVAIRAVAGLDGVQLVVAGDGPERTGLEVEAAGAGNVTFLGSVADPEPVLWAADVLVLPSRSGDSMPGVLIEAGFAGVPSIATRVGAIPDLIEDGISGLLLDAAEPEALRAAIAGVRDDPDARRAMGARAQRHVTERFEIGVVAERWLEVADRAVRG